MQEEVIFAGFGGQGVLFAGQLLAYTAMDEGKHVTWIPSYGPEMRGGTANCPIASNPENIVVLNTPSLYSFQNRVAPEGVIFLNSSIVSVKPSRHDVRIVEVPSSEIAEKLGNPRASNTVMMGAFMKVTGLVPADIYLNSLEMVMGSKKKAVIEINRKAFAAGYEYLK